MNDAELELGLGTVLQADARTVTLVFMATGDTRTYAQSSARLTRALFGPGDTIRSSEGDEIVVAECQEQDGLYFYHGHDNHGQVVTLSEVSLDHFIRLNRPRERLLSGQIDADRWFNLRAQTWQALNHHIGSELRGLTGARTALLKHQLYVAHEVGRRYAPRVLLADEVGLGKTIEAGLILYQQWLREQTQRVLIVVPDGLVHQWLVEMLRRFNLQFAIFDDSRWLALQEQEENQPFETEQLVLCALSFLISDQQRLAHALASHWDMLIVDEAHHLQWTPEQASPEYQCIEQLARNIRSVLLLTATPEQLGRASHFARLRLLDPHRFPSYDAFVAEEAHYTPIAAAIQPLLKESNDSTTEFTPEILTTLSEFAKNDPRLTQLLAEHSQHRSTLTRRAIVEHLLDRHGTGRVLFRNTRAAVGGFAQRQAQPVALPLPEPYQRLQQSNQDPAAALLAPEQHCPDWTDFDPRVSWLQNTLNALKPAKVLIITAQTETVLDLAAYLQIKTGIYAAVFHENLSIVERDRAAAYFADIESGSQVLICSEVGSEGRNFQFAHHLVLFDLPRNPDILEQRIGRLDRIGQRHTVHVHIPYLQDCAHERLFLWYHNGLDAFAHSCATGQVLATQFYDDLQQALCGEMEGESFKQLLQDTHRQHLALQARMRAGRDVLLELNSCRDPEAEHLLQGALQNDADSALPDYAELVFDCFDIQVELQAEHVDILRPGDHMLIPLPGLSAAGTAVTYDRDTALTLEDVQFLSWDHPLIRSAMDHVCRHEIGNTSLIALKGSGLPQGRLLVEALYVLDAPSDASTDLQVYLPPTLIRLLLDERQRELSTRLPAATMAQWAVPVDRKIARKVLKAKSNELRKIIQTADTLAIKTAQPIVSHATARGTAQIQSEIERLRDLAVYNPNVRAEEIEYLDQQLIRFQALAHALQPRLDALRVIVTT